MALGVRVLLACFLVGSASCRSTARPKSALEALPVLKAPSEPLRIDFLPQAGKVLTERSGISRVESFPDGRKVREEKVASTLTTRFDSNPEGGWLLTQQATSVEVTRDGQPVKDPLVTLVTLFPLKVALSKDGSFVRLANPGDVEEAVKKAFTSPGQAAAVLQFFTPDAIEKQAREEWADKYGGLFGRNLAVGEVLYSLESFGLSTGAEVTYAVERKVEGEAETGLGRAVVLSVRCLSDPAQATHRPALEKLLEEHGAPRLEPSVKCEGQQAVSPRPFAPVRSWMKLEAQSPGAASAPALQVVFVRQVEALALE